MPFEAIIIAYAIALSLLSLISLNRYVLVSYCRAFQKRRREQTRVLVDADAPPVTIQLPLYNECYVAERIIRSACEVDYPLDKLEIQVLDDSTDDTLEISRAVARQYRERGVNISVLHRTDRKGFKSGALANGLAAASGEFVAVFDADFIIPSDFLRRTMPYFDDQHVGVVQARWTYINEDYSLVTRAAAMGLDAEFAIEQPARCWGGLFLGFNGTGGVLRVRCIEEAGGWQDDTITEDLDLSYRAQLVGWRIEYLFDVTCPSEIPADIHGLKAQQFRWTKGTQETAKKLLPRLWRAPISRWLKLQGTLHLLANSSFPLLLLVGILNPLMVVAAHGVNIRLAWPISAYFIFSLFGTYSYHGEAIRYIHRDWVKRMMYFPFFLAQGIGLSVNNAKAAMEAWIGKRSEFIRTPKYDLISRDRRWQPLRYRSKFSWLVVFELGLGAYTAAAAVYAIEVREYGALPFLILFSFGYFLVGFYSLQHRILVRRAGVGSATGREPALSSRPAA